ncbi:MAG: CocE/NonD family hydrolase [Actinomycetota bacterium]
MQIVDRFPQQVRDIENLWIPMRDGTRLAARMWLPEGVDQCPVPAIIEYIPYRKRDGTRERDEAMYPWFAGHGYACLRIDMRGSGDSDGLLFDEYEQQELDDGVDAIAWIAAQPWCTGNVGMMGKSWSGFNALQVAALRPPALKAIIPIHSSDDRFHDDVHYRGGCLLNDNPDWSAVMQSISVLPPDPEVVGGRWREMWMQRLVAQPFWLSPWMRHQTKDAYWKHASVSEHYEAIECAVFAVGGWADSYTNTPFRLASGLRAPWKVLVGPWGHQYPLDGVPGPAIGFLQECLRWWDHWLKGIDNGVMDEPRMRVWMQESVRPSTHHAERPGRWVAEHEWPSRGVEVRPLALGIDRLGGGPADAADLTVWSPVTTGLTAGRFCGYGVPGDAPGDQAADDAVSLVFDTAPLPDRLEMLGAAEAELEVTVDQPNAFVVVRLCDVAPDGSSTRVSWGLSNLTHRNGHEAVEPVVPGDRMRVSVRLDHIAHSFPPGHRVRLTVSSAHWPIVWPSPAPVALTVHTEASRFLLPVRDPRPDDDGLSALPEPLRARGGAFTRLAAGDSGHSVERDAESAAVTVRVWARGDFEAGEGVVRMHDIGLDVAETYDLSWTITPPDPLSAAVSFRQATRMRRGEWDVAVDATVRMRATAAEFVIEADVEALESGETVSRRTWQETVPRKGV